MREKTTYQAICSLMTSIGRGANGPGKVYFTGGVSAVLKGWRESTIDVDLKFSPEPSGVFELLPKLKESLNINIELAAPDDFIPQLPGWRERSHFIEAVGPVEFYHYDFYSQALAKIERSHEQDITDVQAMKSLGLIDIDKVRELFQAIEVGLNRYPAIDLETFREQLESVLQELSKLESVP